MRDVVGEPTLWFFRPPACRFKSSLSDVRVGTFSFSPPLSAGHRDGAHSSVPLGISRALLLAPLPLPSNSGQVQNIPAFVELFFFSLPSSLPRYCLDSPKKASLNWSRLSALEFFPPVTSRLLIARPSNAFVPSLLHSGFPPKGVQEHSGPASASV